MGQYYIEYKKDIICLKSQKKSRYKFNYGKEFVDNKTKNTTNK
jgi:hypothetical protein